MILFQYSSIYFNGSNSNSIIAIYGNIYIPEDVDDYAYNSIKYRTYSSFVTYPDNHFYSALRTTEGSGAWSPRTTQMGTEFMTIRLKSLDYVLGVVTQGRLESLNTNQYVSTFQLQYSIDTIKYHYVENERYFLGNNDGTKEVYNYFSKPILAKVIKIIPIGYNNWPSMRAALITSIYPNIQNNINTNNVTATPAVKHVAINTMLVLIMRLII